MRNFKYVFEESFLTLIQELTPPNKVESAYKLINKKNNSDTQSSFLTHRSPSALTFSKGSLAKKIYHVGNSLKFISFFPPIHNSREL